MLLWGKWIIECGFGLQNQLIPLFLSFKIVFFPGNIKIFFSFILIFMHDWEDHLHSSCFLCQTSQFLCYHIVVFYATILCVFFLKKYTIDMQSARGKGIHLNKRYFNQVSL